MGVHHVRALILAVIVTAPLRAHEIGTMRVDVVFHRDHTWSAKVTGGRKFVAQAAEARFDGVTATTAQIPPHAKTFTWRYAAARSTYALSLTNEGQNTARQWIEGDAVSAPFVLSRAVVPATLGQTIRDYLRLGFTHIVPEGLDHILFVFGMFLLTKRARDVLAQVTAFTIAHSITLGLTMYGVVALSPRVVEPAIALSIAYIAIENVFVADVKPWRVAIVFSFGLLHGMGFAGALRELGLPRSQFLPALVSFNAGVELAQLSLIAVLSLILAKRWRTKIVVPASLAIAATGIVWTFQRVF